MVDVSVIIATWNRCERLAITLDAIAQCRIQSSLQWELILIANRCTDNTEEIVRSFVGRLPLVYLEEPQPGKSRALNSGLTKARGELIVFADDDVRPCPEWLKIYCSAFNDRGDRYHFGGPLRSEYEGGQPPDAELLRVGLNSVAGLDFGRECRLLRPEEHFSEANWACPADALRKSGAYDTRLGLDSSLGRRRVGEGFDLMERLNEQGVAGVYLPDAWVFHFVPKAKWQLDQIAENWRAGGVYSLHKRTDYYLFEHAPRLKILLGEEKWPLLALSRLCLTTACLATRWGLARLAGKKAYDDYVALHFCLGRLKGYRETGSSR